MPSKTSAAEGLSMAVAAKGAGLAARHTRGWGLLDPCCLLMCHLRPLVTHDRVPWDAIPSRSVAVAHVDGIGSAAVAMAAC